MIFDRSDDLHSKNEFEFIPKITILGIILFFFVVFCIIHTSQLRSI